MADNNIQMTDENAAFQGHHTKVFGIVVNRILPFIELRWFSFALSLTVITAGIVMYFVYGGPNGGFKMGVDFQGGSRIQVVINTPDITIHKVREAFEAKKKMADINTIGDPAEKIFLITAPVVGQDTTGNESSELFAFVQDSFGKDNVTLRGSELVGPKMGQAFGVRAIQLLAIVALLIMIYTALRFDFYYGFGAIMSLLHDALTMLAFAVFFRVPIDITVIAAILTILGYSINDTIVVYDRIRELNRLNPDENYGHVVDKSITQTLSRTIITSLTVIAIAACIYYLGGEVLKNFAFLLLVGLVCGTYSSIFIAAPITYMLKMGFDKKMKKPGKGVPAKA